MTALCTTLLLWGCNKKEESAATGTPAATAETAEATAAAPEKPAGEELTVDGKWECVWTSYEARKDGNEEITLYEDNGEITGQLVGKQGRKTYRSRIEGKRTGTKVKLDMYESTHSKYLAEFELKSKGRVLKGPFSSYLTDKKRKNFIDKVGKPLGDYTCTKAN
ncbi:MAG: hypothetical protein ACPGUV_11420 [Polyangiales bacterium]